MIAGSLVAGHLIAGRRQGEQTTLALECATGNIGLAILIASSFTTMERALPVIVPYVFTSAIICVIYVRLRRLASSLPGRKVAS